MYLPTFKWPSSFLCKAIEQKKHLLAKAVVSELSPNLLLHIHIPSYVLIN